ncbi:MAG: alpha/beta hydrolase [Candidatus Obscuribacterales bacterium]|nr:alpha/beta hydrolase [Candidatus Obscuribacterales bacterium]
MTLPRSLTVLLAAMASCLIFACGAFGTETPPRLLRVPVYFITDRNLPSPDSAQKAAFGPHRKYIVDCKHDPYMGSGYCVVQNTDGKLITDELKKLGWSAASEDDQPESCNLELIQKETFGQIQDSFYKSVAASALVSKKAETVLFAHGFNTTFKTGYRTAARFAYKFEAPVILYSWPSAGRVRGYSTDETNNEWSQEHFNEAMERLESMCSTDARLTVRIFAHSMGTRLVVRATPFLRERKYITEAALVCPDIDAEVVEHYAKRYLSLSGTTAVRLYMSQHDKALVASQLIHGGYCRLGECADSIKSLITGTLQTNPVKTETPEQEGEALVQAKRRMHTIDFTTLDRGFIGHNIPVDLLYNFSTSGLPGPGLTTITERSGERNRMSRLFSRLSHLDPPKIAHPDNCLRIVKTKGVTM